MVFFLRNHHDAFFALACDALWPLGPRSSKHFAEAGFGSLNLSGLASSLEVGLSGRSPRPSFFIFILVYIRCLVSNAPACTGANPEPMPSSPYVAPSLTDDMRTSGSAAPSALIKTAA